MVPRNLSKESPYVCQIHSLAYMSRDQSDARFEGWYCVQCFRVKSGGAGVTDLVPVHEPITEEDVKNAVDLPSADSILEELKKLA